MPTLTDEAAARARLDVLPGLTWRPFERDDLPAILEFYAECEAYDDNPERSSLVELQEFWDSPRSRPAEDTLAGWGADGRVVATAWAGCNRAITEKRGVYLGGAVRPDRRGGGIGRAVLQWEMAHGREWDAMTRQFGYGPLVMRMSAPEGQTDARDLAERHGLAVTRYFFDMSRDLEGLPEAVEPRGIRLVDWAPERSREVHRAIDEAFEDHWGHVSSTEQMWDEMIDSATFRPAWSVLAVDETTGAVVGAAINAAYEQDWEATGVKEGYTGELGVLRTHRGRGVASALLIESMRRFRDAGMQAAALDVDAANPTGALGLYEGLGYHRVASVCVHQLTTHPSV